MTSGVAGKIMIGQFDGTYVLRLDGDVRVTMCSAIEGCLQNIFSAGSAQAVILDLTNTDGLDSTTLGLLAKLGLYVKKHFGVRAVVINADASMLRLLHGVGFGQIFHIEPQAKALPVTAVSEVPAVAISEAETREKVLEAHKILMSLNEQNRAAFSELVQHLEAQPPA